MSGSDSPTFFHGQPWSSWIEKIGRDKPLSDDEKDSEPSSAVMRLSADDIDLYGFCPERDAFYGVVCEICNSIIKPQALIQHMESRHPSGTSNPLPPPSNSTKPPLKTPYCKLSKLKKGQINPQNSNNNKTNNNHSAVKRTAEQQQSNLHSSISTSTPRSPNTETITLQTSFNNVVAASSPVKSPNTAATGQQKRKRFKTDRSLLKDREYDPDRHCGVWIEENGKPCTRSLTCKAHTVSLRRTVTGRSKSFDQLLAEHRASKELPNTKATKLNVTGNVTVTTTTTESSNVNNQLKSSNVSSINEVDAPSSPPVLSLPDTYPLPQVVDLLYQCLDPHGSNKPTKLEEDFANELDSGRIDSSMVTQNNAQNSTIPPISVVLPSLSPSTNISPSTSLLQYSRNISSSPISVEQLMTNKQSPAVPVVPTVMTVNQSITSTTALEGKTPIDIDSESITMYSPAYNDNKAQVTVQVSRSNMVTQLPVSRTYPIQSSITNLNIYNAVDHIDMKNSQSITNNKIFNNHAENVNRQLGLIKTEYSQDSSTAIQVEATTASTTFTNFSDISWSNCHPEPLAVSRWLRITSSRKQYNFNIH